MTQPPHDDPIGEARTQLLQGLAVLSTLGEAGARWVAVGTQKRAADAQAVTRRDEATHEAQKKAAELLGREQRSAQEDIERGLTDWLHRAGFTETARLWRTAAVHAAAGRAQARTAMGLAQDRMRDIHPQFMAHYDRLRAQGLSEVDALRAAAGQVWDSEARSYRPPRSGGWPQPGPVPDALIAGAHGRALPGGPGPLDDLDRAVRAEAARLAEHISPEALNTLQVDMRRSGQTPAADATGLLAQFAEQAVRAGAIPAAAAASLAASLRQRAGKEAEAGSREAGIGDLPATTEVNEHAAGQAASVNDRSAAAHDQALAQQEAMRAAFPGPPRPAAIVANKKPARVVAGPAQVNTRGRGR